MNLIIGNVYRYQCTWIADPHPKIGICASSKASWFFWFNSEARFHGCAQMPIAALEHKACPKNCFLDLSTLHSAPDEELKSAEDWGPLSDKLKARVLAVLSNKIELLPTMKRETVLRNLSGEAS